MHCSLKLPYTQYMITLHNVTEFLKKFGIAAGILLTLFIFISIFLKIGGVINSILFPPKINVPNEAYGKLPPINFPQSTVKGNFTYTLNTLDGQLPQDFPDRIFVYPMIISQPDLLNLSSTRNKVAAIGFNDQDGKVLPEISRGGPMYEWDEAGGLGRKIVYNIVNNSFTMSSNYLSSLTVLNAQYLGDQASAVQTVQDFLNQMNLFPTDVDLTLTQNPSSDTDYVTSPLLYSIASGNLQPVTSISDAQIIRVDLYQKEVDYSFTAATGQDLTHFQNFDMKLPIIYPHPPYSTMSFLIGSNDTGPVVVSAIFSHQGINLQPDQQATYPIKSAQDAFNDLKNGKGFVAAYNGSDSQILINKVYLAYYVGTSVQNYLEPVVVFEGQDDFFAYVPAITTDALQ